MKADFPMKHPDYSFDHAPTPEELRQTAIRAMHDMLSAEWYSPESFVYHKKGAASGKTYAFEKDTVYGGLPYTDCNVSLFAFLEYIDPVTGQLKVPEVMEGFDDLGIAVNNRLGNTCTGSTGWGVLSVCQSVRGGLVSYYLLPKNGFFPLGDIEIDPELDTFVKEPTDGICARYGLQTLCRAYALVQGADLVVQQPVNPSAGHSMMALETPHVVYTEDGQIDAEESRLAVQDQYTGTFYQKNEAGHEVGYIGHLRKEFTFAELFRKHYIPVSTAEFLGTKPYVPGAVTAQGSVSCAEDLKTAQLSGNYPMVLLKLTAEQNGTAVTVFRRAFTRAEVMNGEARQTELSALAEALQDAELAPGSYTVCVEVTLSTGQVFTPFVFRYER